MFFELEIWLLEQDYVRAQEDTNNVIHALFDGGDHVCDALF